VRIKFWLLALAEARRWLFVPARSSEFLVENYLSEKAALFHHEIEMIDQFIAVLKLLS